MNGSYVHIESFMVEELHLKGNELIAYAVVHGFSQDGSSVFCGSSAYIAKWCGCTKKTAITILNKLAGKGLIEKIDKFVNGVHLCDYRAVFFENEKGYRYPQNYTGVGKFLHRGGEVFTPGGGEKITPHTIEVDTIGETIEDKANGLKDETAESVIEQSEFSDAVKASLREFAEYREERKQPLTAKAAEKAINVLRSLPDDETRIKSIDQSILNNWRGLFDVKGSFGNGSNEKRGMVQAHYEESYVPF